MTHFAHTARTHAVAALIGAIAIAGMGTPAQASGKTGAEPLAQQICQTVIRVQPGEYHFDGCVSSLAASVDSASRDRAVAQARNDCFVQGLKPGSADLGLCLLRAGDATPGPSAIELPDATRVTTAITDDPRSSKPYSSISSDAAFHREQQACALLGFDPAFGAFASCVTDLQNTLRPIVLPEG